MINSKLVSNKVLIPSAIVALAVGLIIWGLPQAIAATTNQTNPRAPGNLQMPNITGSVALGPTILSIHKAIASQTHVSLANASIIAEKAVGSNAHAMEGSIGVVHGFLVYVVHVVDPSNNIHGVIVDPGNGKVLGSFGVHGFGGFSHGPFGHSGVHGFGGFWHGPLGDGMTQ